MLDTIKSSFPQLRIGTCLETRTETEFYVYDHSLDNRCYIHADSKSIKQFIIENPDMHSIHFLAIDKCLLSDSDTTKRCDFAVFDSQTFCLVEIKTTSSMTQRKKQRRDAKDQLLAAINYFKQHLSFTTEKLEAYICLVRQESTSLMAEDEELADVRPLNRASLVEEIEEFAEVGFEIFHDNRKRFA